MKIVFLSNYFNHHQKPLSDELYMLSDGNYHFIETMPMESERIKMGWESNSLPDYVIQSHNSHKEFQLSVKLVESAEVVIIGSAPELFIKQRLKEGKLVFRYHERPLKKGNELFKFPVRFFRWRKNNPKDANIFMLSASAYTAGDYSKFGLFRNKSFKWGYFTEVKLYDNLSELIEVKSKNSIIWVARFIDLKHPEVVCSIGEKLLKDGIDFKIDMIGDGELLEGIRNLINEKGLSKNIHLLGSVKPSVVRKYMEKSEIHIFTSDRNEGWGAVLNESMNSACVPISSHAIGATPFLINDGENGIVYEDGNTEDLYFKLKFLLTEPTIRKEMSFNAYNTIVDMWSPRNAASRFIELAEAILLEKELTLFEDGPCSKCEIISDNWFQQKKGKVHHND